MSTQLTPEQLHTLAEVRKSKYFKTTFGRTLDLIQLLKYSLEDFKQLDIHKEVDKAKDMRPECVQLLNAINAFLLRTKTKCSPTTFNGLMRVMSREYLHDLSHHMDVVTQIKDITSITAVLDDELQKVKNSTSPEEEKT